MTATCEALTSSSSRRLCTSLKSFDHCVDGVVNFKKCATYATTASARKQVSSVTLDGKSLKVVSDDRLLGGHLCSTKRRARWLANQRATKYLEVARRICICPLSINAKFTLLATAGAAKFLFGIELGACTRKLEAQVRKAVVNAVWSKRSCKSNDIVLALCFRGHRADPTQIRLIQPFITIRRQLKKHPDMCQLWTHIWLNTQKQRDKFKDFRSNAVGPVAILSQVCRELNWDWLEPLVFKVPIGHSRHVSFHLLQYSDEYFLHILRWAASSMLWRRAAASRKDMKGIQQGIDKVTTLKVLNSPRLNTYDHARGCSGQYLLVASPRKFLNAVLMWLHSPRVHSVGRSLRPLSTCSGRALCGSKSDFLSFHRSSFVHALICHFAHVALGFFLSVLSRLTPCPAFTLTLVYTLSLKPYLHHLVISQRRFIT